VRSLGLSPAIRLVGTGTINPTKAETAALYIRAHPGDRTLRANSVSQTRVLI